MYKLLLFQVMTCIGCILRVYPAGPQLFDVLHLLPGRNDISNLCLPTSSSSTTSSSASVGEKKAKKRPYEEIKASNDDFATQSSPGEPPQVSTHTDSLAGVSLSKHRVSSSLSYSVSLSHTHTHTHTHTHILTPVYLLFSLFPNVVLSARPPVPCVLLKCSIPTISSLRMYIL